MPIRTVNLTAHSFAVLIWCVALSALLTSAGHAQVTPSASGSLGTNVTAGPTYEITGGTRPGGGTNLFHSFGKFSLLVGETAMFKDPAPPLTTNIIGRITGGPSSIWGTIDTATYYMGANLFLINPAGVVFGATASLNVGGSFHISTADYIKLSDGVLFNAIPGAADALLTSAAPAAFGFLGPTFASIDVQGSTLSVPTGEALSLVGGDITVTNDAVNMTAGALSAPSGRINLVSVASPGEVLMPSLQTGPNVNGQSFTSMGVVTLQGDTTIGSVIVDVSDLSGEGSGTVSIRGGQLVMDSALVFANSTGIKDGALVAISVNVQGDVTLRNGSGFLVSSSAIGSPTGRAGDIEISGQTVQFESGSGVVIGTTDAPGSNLLITAQQVSLTGGSLIQSNTSGNGNGGTVTVSTSDSLLIAGDSFGTASFIQTSTDGAGAGSSVIINGGSATLADLGYIQTTTSLGGRAGNINFQVGNLNVTGGGNIRTTGAIGSSGAINISADVVSLSGQFDPFSPSRIENVAGVGPSGDTAITARQLSLDGGSRIVTDTQNQQSGNITIAATELVSIAGGSGILMSVRDVAGGTLSISAPTITMNQGTLQTSTAGIGTAGAVALNVGTLTLSNASLITSDTQQGLASGGVIAIAASDSISLVGGSSIRTNSFAGGGPAGTISLAAGNVISLAGSGTGLLSESVGAGAGGTIAVQGNQVQLSSGATISANSTGTGDAGNINITAGQLNLFDSSITTQAALASGGNVTIMAGELVRLNNSQINTSVAGGPTTAGGDIMIDPPFVVLQNNSQILAQAFAGLGGNITIVAGALFVDPTSSISASSQLGISGSVNVQSPVFFLSGTLVPLPKTPVQAASLLQARCAARMQGGQESNFVQRGRDGLPPEPGGWLTSPMLAAGSPPNSQVGRDDPSPGQDVLLAQADVESSPMTGATSDAGPLTRLASASETAGCGLELVLAQ